MCSCSWPHHRSERSASHSVTLPRAAQTPARPRTVLESFLALIISRFSGEENGRADQRPCANALKGNVGVDEGASGDRKSVGEGKSVSVGVDRGGRRINKQTKK